MDKKKIDISELPVHISAFEDDNGYALEIKADDARIGRADNHLASELIIRIVRGATPVTTHAHPVAITKEQTRFVEVADARIDEGGHLFVTDAASGISHPAAPTA